jgi:hypothetical protein
MVALACDVSMRFGGRLIDMRTLVLLSQASDDLQDVAGENYEAGDYELHHDVSSVTEVTKPNDAEVGW